MSAQSIPCDYCGCQSELVTGAEVYPHRTDLAHKLFYLCRPCKAWVGCHPGTSDPLGRLADAELRMWKSRAHAAFDPIWRAKQTRQNLNKRKARSSGYLWLAKQMEIEPDLCHIGMFSVEQCRRVVEICEPYSSRIKERAA